MDIGKLHLSRHRIDALADGVFAIVATLIVLELHLPELDRSATSQEIFQALRHLAFPLFSFLVTFGLAGAFWYLHQVEMHYIERVDRNFLWLNIGFLMFVSLLPFSTTLLGRFHVRASVPQLVYFINQFGIASMLWLQWRYAYRRGLTNADAEAASAIGARTGSLALGAGLAALFSFAAPMFSFYGFIIPVVAMRVREKRRQRLAA